MFGFGSDDENNTSAPSSSGTRQLSDDDLDKLAFALVKRIHSPKGFHLFEFIFGVALTLGLCYFLYRRRSERLMHRHRESDAVELLETMDDAAIKRILGNSHLPSWVNFPDFERVGWLNEILSQLWPSINAAVSNHFREMLGPLLRENKPSWIASVKLYRFDLGDVAPYANGVKIYKQEAESKDEVIMEIDFSWIGEQEVQLDIKPIPKHLGPLSPAGHLLSSIVRLRAGIERITVNGRLRFVWRPLLDEPPVIGGMQVALVNMPTFSFDVTLYGGAVSLVPGLEAWLDQFMRETVFRPYILPEVYKLPFSEAAENEHMKPVAILLVTAIKATHVPKMDLFSASDPYLRMFMRNSAQLRTATKQNNANPVWNEDFRFFVHDLEAQEFTMVLMDYDEMNPDDTIGRCVIPIRDMECSKTKEYCLTVDMNSDISDAPEVKAKNAGFVDTIIAAEQKIADQGDKLWKKLPGVRQKGGEQCQLYMQCTLYKLDSEDIESILEDHQKQKRQSSLQKVSNGSHHHRDSLDGSHTEDDQAEAERSGHDRDKGNDLEIPDTDPTGKDGERKGTPTGSSGYDPEDQEESEAESRKGVSEGEGKVLKEEEDRKAEKEEAEKRRPKLKGKTVKKIDTAELKSRAHDALTGGILSIMPKKAVDLVRKPWYKASFLKSAAQLEASVCGQFKRTASVPGSQPIFNEKMEFLIGGHDLKECKKKMLKIEVWDHKLHLNHFRGGCSLDLSHIVQAQRISKTMKLSGVRRGELTVEVAWTAAHAAAHHQ